RRIDDRSGCNRLDVVGRGRIEIRQIITVVALHFIGPIAGYVALMIEVIVRSHLLDVKTGRVYQAITDSERWLRGRCRDQRAQAIFPTVARRSIARAVE